MSVAWFLKDLLAILLLPPANGLLLICLAGLYWRRRWAFGLAAFGTALLVLQSLPPVAGALMASLEERAGPVLQDTDGAQAIVVLSGGLDLKAPEYGGDTAGERTLLRLRYGALLAKRFDLPLLVTGGRPKDATRTEAAVMAEILEREFTVKVRWQEGESWNTAENASKSAAILRDAGIQRIVLVTQAFHMPRAVRLFRAAGLEVVPAPTQFKTAANSPLGPLDLLPQSNALRNSYFALHEWLGIAWLVLTVERTPAQ
jgi:uncharacterized SAM-binding protein YcdF (DUF218 family)